MADRPGDELREIARELRAEADTTLATKAHYRLALLASRLNRYADSIDETIAVLSDPDSMAAIEEDRRDP